MITYAQIWDLLELLSAAKPLQHMSTGNEIAKDLIEWSVAIKTYEEWSALHQTLKRFGGMILYYEVEGYEAGVECKFYLREAAGEASSHFFSILAERTRRGPRDRASTKDRG